MSKRLRLSLTRVLLLLALLGMAASTQFTAPAFAGECETSGIPSGGC